MMEGKHTPGPWTVGRDYCFGPQGIGVGVIVAACPNHEAQANARLIAAAPDMLEALRRVKEELRLIRMKDTDAVYDVMLRTDIDAAIARATGQ